MPELNKVSKLARTSEILWVFGFVVIVEAALLPNPPTKPALKPEFNWVVLVLVLSKWVAPNLPTKLALKPKLDWVVDYKPVEMPEFCCLPLQEKQT
jgi:hypothetical protein